MGSRIPTRQAMKVLACILIYSDLNTIIHVIMVLGEMFYNTIGDLTMKLREMIKKLSEYKAAFGDDDVMIEVLCNDDVTFTFENVGVDVGTGGKVVIYGME